MIKVKKVKNKENEVNLRKNNKYKDLKIIYLIILIILLIFTFVVSFKTGESIYYLINTNPKNKDTSTSSDIANWNFEVIIKY